jgi:hypothetical protein
MTTMTKTFRDQRMAESFADGLRREYSAGERETNPQPRIVDQYNDTNTLCDVVWYGSKSKGEVEARWNGMVSA